MAHPDKTYCPQAFDVVFTRTTCYRCGLPVNITVEVGQRIPPKLCSACKVVSPDGWIIDGDETPPPVSTRPCKTYHLPCIVYRPGDPGFAELAALYERQETREGDLWALWPDGTLYPREEVNEMILYGRSDDFRWVEVTEYDTDGEPVSWEGI